MKALTSMSPAVSVILPNYNHSAYLHQRIESVLKQTFTNIELILLDDCSTDNSREIISGYSSHPKVSHIVLNEKNSGSTFVQWQRGISLAKGKYIWIAESDDVADPTFLSTLIPLLEDNPDAVMAFTGSRIIDSNGNEIPKADWDRYRPGMPETETYTSRGLISKKLLRNNGIYNASMAVFRRDKAPEITPEQMKMRFCGDWKFWFELAQRGQAIEVRRKLNAFRQHLNKVSASASKEGLTYTEGLPLTVSIADYLSLTPLQRHLLAGRIYKRLRKFPTLLNSHPEIAASLNRLSPNASTHPLRLICLYEAHKLLNSFKTHK